jgi:hypothetical protein
MELRLARRPVTGFRFASGVAAIRMLERRLLDRA